MNCPKCKAEFERVQTRFGEIARCTECKGVWIDTLEHAQIKAVASIDIGDTEVGKKFNSLAEVMCPSCPNSKMLRMVDPKQPHIWLESCPTCHGNFYDAGELKDFSEHTLADFFKKFGLKERS